MRMHDMPVGAATGMPVTSQDSVKRTEDVMWPPAIEEQFYLVLPILTFPLFPRARAAFAAAIVVLGLGRGVFRSGFACLRVSLLLAMLTLCCFAQPAMRRRSHFIASECRRVRLFVERGLMTLICVVALIPTPKSS